MKSLTPVALLAAIASTAAGGPFDPDNILVTHGNVLHEYTLDGVLVQSFNIPHPDTDRYDAADAVVDRFGRAHVLNDAPFDNRYWTTLDPVTGAWTHTREDGLAFGNASDGDLAIMGDSVWSSGNRLDIDTLTTMDAQVDMFNGPSEQSIGLDGWMYAINSGSPRYNVVRADPFTLEVLDDFDVRDDSGTRLDGRGLAIAEDGTLFVADWDGFIYKYDADHNYIERFDTGANNLLDLDLRADGTLIVGSRFGDVVVTDTEFSHVESFSVGSGLVYVGWVSVQGEGCAADLDGDDDADADDFFAYLDAFAAGDLGVCDIDDDGDCDADDFFAYLDQFALGC